jgi:hypothetical protein
MRSVVGLVAVMVAQVAPLPGAPAGGVDAQMLLDLDLLRDADPARHRDQAIVERLRLLELLRAIEAPVAPGAPPRERPASPAPAGKER